MAVFNEEDSKFYCECRCGTQIHFDNRFAPGHHMRMPEARARSAKLMAELGRQPRSPEWKHRLSESARRDWARLTPEEKEKRLKNSVLSEAAKKAMREAKRTPEVRAKISRKTESDWAELTPEEKSERIRKQFGSVPPEKPNKVEKMLQKFLEQAFPDMFIPDWVERADIGGRHPDFRTKNGYKLVIESNSNHWHGEEFNWGEEEQIAHYKKYGWTCIVVWADYSDDIICEWPNLARRINTLLKEAVPIGTVPASLHY